MPIDYAIRLFPDSSREEILKAVERVAGMDAVDGHSQAEIPIADGLRTVLVALSVDGKFSHDSYWDAVVMIQQIIDEQ